MRFVRRARVWGAIAAGGLLAVGVPMTALASGVPVAPSSGLPLAPPTTPPSLSPAGPLGAIGPSNPVLTFGAKLPSGAPIVNNPDPIVCATGCWEYTFRAPAASPSLLIAVKSIVTGPNGTFNADNGFDLYVYGPDHQLAGAANGVGSNGQAVVVPAPAAGTYTVVVTYTYSYDAGSGFRGEVRLERGPSWSPGPATCGIVVGGVSGCFDLPALRALPAYDFTASGIPPVPSTPLGFPLPVNLPVSTSCYSDETVGLDNLKLSGQPVLKCLRFTTDIQNVGAGPLTAQIGAAVVGPNGVQLGYVPGGCNAYQVVSRSDGAPVTRPAGSCEFHIEHAHFHYDGLLLYALYQAGAGDTLGPQVGVSKKESFCLTDDDYFGFGTAGPNGPRANVGQPDCNLPREVNLPVPSQPGSGTYITEGITPGWGDVYTWDTPDQFIDVTRVPSGVYDVVEETNPTGDLLVGGPQKTCAMSQIRLTAGTAEDTVQQVGSVDSIPCP